MAINVLTQFKKPTEKGFVAASYTDMWCGKEYDWSGENAITTLELLNGSLNDYNLSGGLDRTGTIHDVQDIKRTYPITQMKSFREFFDGIHINDTGFIRKATVYMKQLVDFLLTPYVDKYRMKTWANGAGLGYLNTTQLTKQTVVEAILAGLAEMDDEGVPTEGRCIFIRSDIAVKTRLANELQYSQNWTDKTIVKGKIAEIGGIPVVSVGRNRMPQGVEFMIKFKNASADPFVLRNMKTHQDPPGRFGVEMNALFYFDSFVLGSKCNGIYVYAESDMQAAVTYTLSGTSLTLTSSGGTIKYTKDGSNPKNSSTSETYSAALTVASGDHIRAYASASNKLNSYITDYTVE